MYFVVIIGVGFGAKSSHIPISLGPDSEAEKHLKNEWASRRQAREAFDGNLAFAFTPRTSLIDAGRPPGPPLPQLDFHFLVSSSENIFHFCQNMVMEGRGITLNAVRLLQLNSRRLYMQKANWSLFLLLAYRITEYVRTFFTYKAWELRWQSSNAVIFRQ